MERKTKKSKSEHLRQRAEDLLNQSNIDTKALYAEDEKVKLIHELQVYQIELKLQNEELTESIERVETASNRYSDLYDYAPIGYFTLSKEGCITELNLSGAAMLHKKRSQLTGRMFIIFVSDDTKPVFKLFLDKVFGSLMQESCEVILTPAGLLPMHASLTGIATKDAERCLLTVADITGRKQAESDLILKNRELEKLIIQKDIFFSIMAHDLRGPFNGFLGLTEIIAKESSSLETHEIQKMGETMWKSATNLFKLLENLLQWSQMEQGIIPFTPAVFRLYSFASESLTSEIQTSENKEIAVNFDIPQDIDVFADAKMLRSILSNLYSNATKFTPKGGQITVSAKYSGLDRVEISIKDSGIGISKDEQDKLFQLNEQINRKGTDGELSTGLGLFLCKEFIEKHNGSIWVESQEGKGSTFRFTMPGIPNFY